MDSSDQQPSSGGSLLAGGSELLIPMPSAPSVGQAMEGYVLLVLSHTPRGHQSVGEAGGKSYCVES